jgi:hypothetical protein
MMQHPESQHAEIDTVSTTNIPPPASIIPQPGTTPTSTPNPIPTPQLFSSTPPEPMPTTPQPADVKERKRMYNEKYTSREDVKERRRITEKKYRSRADVKEKKKKKKKKTDH